jgi:Arc/MetJ-type ribon-helix-helix transcriptional regulator
MVRDWVLSDKFSAIKPHSLETLALKAAPSGLGASQPVKPATVFLRLVLDFGVVPFEARACTAATSQQNLKPKAITATQKSNQTPFSPAERRRPRPPGARLGSRKSGMRGEKPVPLEFLAPKAFLILEIFVERTKIWSMTMSLLPQLEARIAARVKNGVYNNIEQVLTQALELLKMQEDLETQSTFLSQDAKRRAALRELVEQGQLLNMGY